MRIAGRYVPAFARIIEERGKAVLPAPRIVPRMIVDTSGVASQLVVCRSKRTMRDLRVISTAEDDDFLLPYLDLSLSAFGQHLMAGVGGSPVGVVMRIARATLDAQREGEWYPETKGGIQGPWSRSEVVMWRSSLARAVEELCSGGGKGSRQKKSGRSKKVSVPPYGELVRIMRCAMPDQCSRLMDGIADMFE